MKNPIVNLRNLSGIYPPPKTVVCKVNFAHTHICLWQQWIIKARKKKKEKEKVLRRRERLDRDCAENIWPQNHDFTCLNQQWVHIRQN